jgi:hypothetical protein
LKKDFSPDADTVADEAVADMIAFDQLGPLTRAAITGMCVQLSALGVLQLIRQRYPGMHESNQRVDREIATMLRLAEQDSLKLIDRAYCRWLIHRLLQYEGLCSLHRATAAI